MKEQIIRLRKEGKTYKEIQSILGCSKSTISYHCGDGQRERSADRNRKRRKKITFLKKIEHFQKRKGLRNKCDDFQRERLGRKGLGKRDIKFTYKDVIEKFGDITTCYLTGRQIDILKPKSYVFDHIIPVSKGGENTISNLGITCKEANTAKGDLTLEELLCLCQDILKHHGYEIKRK